VFRTQLPVGDLLWSTDPLGVVTVETLGDSATVVITGRAGVFELSTFRNCFPSMIWAGWFPYSVVGG
jgi:hypothetical protein